jgi:thioredoxin
MYIKLGVIMQHTKYALALLCSISLTSCWPASDENDTTSSTKSASAIRHISEESEFTRTIKQGNIVIDFYADWCGPCKRLGPVIGDLAKEFNNVKFVKVNIDTASSISSRYNVRSIPTLIFFKNGKEVKKVNGYQSKSELRSILKSVF